MDDRWPHLLIPLRHRDFRLLCVGEVSELCTLDGRVVLVTGGNGGLPHNLF